MRKDHANFVAKKRAQEPIVMVTCYDYPTAQMEDAAGIDIIFVGDSVGTNVLGYAAETEVTMADMLHHLKAVRRGVQAAYLLVDLPYGAYDTPQLALANARRLVAQGADAREQRQGAGPIAGRGPGVTAQCAGSGAGRGQPARAGISERTH